MRVHAVASNIVSSLGMDVAAHWQAITTRKQGIKCYSDAAFNNTPFYAARLDPVQWQRIAAQVPSSQALSPFEQLAIYSAMQAIAQCDIDLKETVFILSTTKGNIEWLGQALEERLLLHSSARLIAQHLGLTTLPITVSNACASGVVSLTQGLRMLQAGKCKHVIITGCDRFTRFVLKGFQSFMAISDAPCRPFDIARKGITLGEAAATIILSAEAGEAPMAELLSGASTNDANHISGPSRTGEELAMAINRAVSEAQILTSQIDIVSAHGTGTEYNDEMEAKAFNLCNLSATPLHSLKGYVGHTLGAAGILESVMLIEALRYQQLIPSAGFEQLGVSQPLNVTTTMQPAQMKYALKTASGFGGCNAAIVWKAIDR